MKHIAAITSADRLLPGIHGLRAVAALMVLLFHLAPLSNLVMPARLGFIGAYFGSGVSLFFVLSAFSLCHSTLVNIDRPGWTRDYFIKRFFRIAPLFYVMLIVWYALFYFRNAAPPFSDVLLNLMFVFNFVPEKYASIVAAGWTVGIEMVFYAIFPVILLLVGRLWHALVFAVLAYFVSIIARMSLEKAGMGPYAGSAFISAFGIFAVGVLAFWVFRWLQDGVAREGNTRKWRWLAITIPALACLVMVSPARHWLYELWGGGACRYCVVQRVFWRYGRVASLVSFAPARIERHEVHGGTQLQHLSAPPIYHFLASSSQSMALCQARNRNWRVGVSGQRRFHHYCHRDRCRHHLRADRKAVRGIGTAFDDKTTGV
jgi:peptidoglycan/LPS O-acetylase OafA/YrhL